MPRVKEFSEKAALDQAMEVFWARGYEATSLQDLIGVMEISKSSFYETFGSKHELFLSAIGNYIDTRVKGLITLLYGMTSGKKAIENIFNYYVENGEKGCFLCNCAVEFAQRDPAVAERISRSLGQIEDAYHQAVVRGQKDGEIPANHDARALAKFLVSSESGLFVSAKSGMDRKCLKDVVKITLSVLE